MSKALLSVITVCYNSDKTIERTLYSILNQTYTNFEYIIIDGGSSDSTIKIIKSFEDKFKERGIVFSWISEKDTGIYNAFNKGIHLSNTQWVSFVGSDDCYTENALELYSSVIFKTEKKVDLIYSNIDIVDDQGKSIKEINAIWTWFKFKRYMYIAHVGAFHNKNYFSKYGFFNESFKICGDYELLLRARNHLKTIKIEKLTVKMASGGVSNTQINLAFKETFRAKNKTARIGVFTCFLDYTIALFKYHTKKIIRAFIR
jgi:glycosyltransferase involved in cell wall biosynthesis